MAQIDPKLQKRISAAITEFADRLRNLGLASGAAALAVQDMAIELDKDGRNGDSSVGCRRNHWRTNDANTI